MSANRNGRRPHRRQAQWARLQNAIFLTRNEKREAAGYGPVPDGDALDEPQSDNADLTSAYP